jgi:CheY-like chemotaxis protein
MAKVLIIDDNQQLLRMHQKILQFSGHEVHTATDGKGGFEKAKSEKPSIILLDIMMPEMDGLEVLEKLKEDQSTKNIPVLILSNLSDEEHAQESVKKGAEKYFIKGDSDPSQIADEIKAILGEKTESKK